MQIQKQRLWSGVEKLASSFTIPDAPYTRRAFTEQFDLAREWLRTRYKDAGLSVSLDIGGNLIGKRDGTDAGLAPIMTGSHMDTTPKGGRFDGIAGVLAGLEVAETLNDHGARLRHPLEVIDFLSEEPSEYGVSCIGSRALVGKLEPDMLDNMAPDGTLLRNGIDKAGGDSNSLATAIRDKNSIAGFIELHIEQGPVLETEGLEIGIVTDIVGITRVDINVIGQAAHSGTTPMHLRRDALIGAAKIIDKIESSAQELAKGEAYLVATIGRLFVIPNGSNVIPGKVDMTMEVRSNNMSVAASFVDDILKYARDVCTDRELEFSSHVVSDSPIMVCDKNIQGVIHEACKASDYSYKYMPSGAGHDASYIAQIGPSGMIFIPCLNGRSHCPEEWVEPEQLATGAQVLLDAILALDRR